MLKLTDVSVTFKNGGGLSHISLTINKGEYVYIVGPTGAGKTTLLRTIYMDVIPNSGEVEFAGFSSLSLKRRQIPFVRRQIGVVFQDFKILGERDAFDNIYLVLRATGSSARDARKKTIRALTNVGLLSKRDNHPEELSGGELQRVCIARAIANNPLLLLADEPTGNLDPETGRNIFSLFKQLNERGITAIIATHNYPLVKEFPGRIIYLENGRMIKQ